jgi:hypothetical protein
MIGKSGWFRPHEKKSPGGASAGTKYDGAVDRVAATIDASDRPEAITLAQVEGPDRCPQGLTST